MVLSCQQDGTEAAADCYLAPEGGVLLGKVHQIQPVHAQAFNQQVCISRCEFGQLVRRLAVLAAEESYSCHWPFQGSP